MHQIALDKKVAERRVTCEIQTVEPDNRQQSETNNRLKEQTNEWSNKMEFRGKGK